MKDHFNKPKYIRLTSHPSLGNKDILPIHWSESNPLKRGPIIATLTNLAYRNAIGTHSGSYAIYRALSVASHQLDPSKKPDFTNTLPVSEIGPFKQWSENNKIVSLDPFGHMVMEVFHDYLAKGYDIRPSIAITKAQIDMPEIHEAIHQGRLHIDGTIIQASKQVAVTKLAIEPVWYLPGLAARFEVEEHELRQTLYEQTGGMYSELVTRPDLNVFLPPIGGMTVYLFGDLKNLGHKKGKIACRVHDECNGSDVFGSDICTCRPYLAHGIEVCIEMAQQGGLGVIVYSRKEGRALGEVTKFLVYNARKRQEGGDTAARYFERTECVAGVQDARFQELMPDVLHWLGINTIDKFVSMSNMKYEAIIKQGIDIKERVPIPDTLIPGDAHVEMDAKIAAGYYTPVSEKKDKDLTKTKGRDL